MKRASLVCLAVLACLAVYPLLTHTAQSPRSKPLQAPEETSFRVLLGVGDNAPTTWDGSVKVAGGRVTSIKGWRFTGDDSTDYQGTWKASTRRAPAGAAAARKKGKKGGPMVDNGVVIGAVLNNPAARFEVRTAQGSFSFTAQEAPLGEARPYLNGRVMVERVPSTLQLTTSDDDEDFPAAAVDGNDVWVAFVQFAHADREREDNMRRFDQAPKDFGVFAAPPGGDQVFLMRYTKSTNVWDTPIAVSAPKQDVMRTAVAVDGSKRVWVFWSANPGGKGNFDLYAKWYKGGQWGPEIRVTTDPGTDVNPVAATDSGGRVWVAWQAFRNGNLDILAAVQTGDRFSPEARVSFSPASDWDPAIAAGPKGQMAVSWDTYDKGDYDVYVRRMRVGSPIQMEAPVPVAASQNFEARSSIAYDPSGRLWVAYEGSSVRWGKDFGAYETTGVALYMGHNVQVRCLEGRKRFTTAEDVQQTLPGPTGVRRARQAVPAAMLPNPKLARERAPSGNANPGLTPLNSFPRLAVDSEGTVYLAVRTPAGAFRSPVGTVWTENVVYFDGTKWNGPIPVPRTDGLLDNRPAVAALAPGNVLLISAMDHRQTESSGGRQRPGGGINSDIYAARFRVEQRPKPAQLKALPPETVAPPEPSARPERAQVAMIRQYRAKVGADTLQLMRGEFHRHTEMSNDGGRDGPLIDAYRYLIDAASMDWGGCCDHDNGGGHEYFWWLQQKLTDAYHLGTKYVPMFAYERSVRYPEGHRNVVFPRRGIRPLGRLPKMDDDSPPSPAPDTQMLYRYLRRFGGIVASHTSGTDMGTDWRDNDPVLEPVVEIYQGDRQNYEMPNAPRSNSAEDSIGGWRPLGFVSLALQKGYRLAFQASSDHISTHMSYCNLWVKSPTRDGIMEAFHKRRVYGATDDILADVRCGEHFMGEEFAVGDPPSLSVKLWGTAPFAKVHIIKDNRYAYTIEPKQKAVSFTWKDNAAVKGKTSYYYVRGEQSDGELVWVSPMWIAYK